MSLPWLVVLAVGAVVLAYATVRLLAPPSPSPDDLVAKGMQRLAPPEQVRPSPSAAEEDERDQPGSVSSIAPARENGTAGTRSGAPTGGGSGQGGGSFASPSPADELIDQLADIQRLYDTDPGEYDRAIRRILDRLGALGDEAVPAIRRLLASGEDLAFAPVNVDGRQVDSSSLRMAMLEMLGTLGGFEAAAVLEEELLRTRSPREIHSIVRFLDEQYPGEYDGLALERAHELLAQMAPGDGEVADPAPLYQLLAELGDLATIAELERQGGAWPIYRAVALAQAPDGIGTPGLIDAWRNGGDPSLQRLSTQLLAQAAGRDPLAAQALVEGLGEDRTRIPDRQWSKIGQALSGKYELQLVKPDLGELPSELDRNPYRTIQMGGEWGTTTVYITDVLEMSPEERLDRLALVEELLALDLGPAANRALEQARNDLEE